MVWPVSVHGFALLCPLFYAAVKLQDSEVISWFPVCAPNFQKCWEFRRKYKSVFYAPFVG